MYKSEINSLDDAILYLRQSNINEYIYMTYPVTFNDKPTADDCGDIQRHFNIYPTESTKISSCKDLATVIENGQSCKFAGAIGALASNYKLSNVIGLDFDIGIDYNIILDKLIDDGLIDYLILGYHTFSSKSDFNRFRLLFRTPVITYEDNYKEIFNKYYIFFSHYFGRHDVKKMIKDVSKIKDGTILHHRNKYEVLYTPDTQTPYIILKNKSVIDRPPSAIDQQTKSPTNLFHGGRKGCVFYTNDARPLELNFLAGVVETELKLIQPSHYNRTLKDDINLIDKKVIISNDNDHLIEYEIIDDTALKILNAYNVQMLKDCCKLYDDIEHSQHHHNEYMHLTYNINVLNNDIKDYFIDNALRHDPDKRWDANLDNAEFRNFSSTKCYNHCPHFDNCHANQTKTILDHMIDCFNGIDNTIYYTIDECREEAKEIYYKMINCKKTGKVKIWQGDCGIGKSYHITHPLQNHESNVTYAFDNHRNKDEKYNEYMLNGGYTSAVNYKHMDDYNIPNLSMIKKAYSQGNSQIASNLLDMTKEGREYKIMSKKIIKGTTFITHERLFTSKVINNHMIIIDEDPLQSLNKTENIEISDCNKLYDFIKKNNTFLADKLRERLDMINNEPRYLDKISPLDNNQYESLCSFIFEYLQSDIGSSCKSNLYLLVSPDVILVRNVATWGSNIGQNLGHIIALNFRIQKLMDHLNNGGNIIIMSATINIELYKLIFGDHRVDEYISKKPKMLANVHIHNEYSFSKSSLYSKKSLTGEIIRSNILSTINNMNCLVITTKDNKENFAYNVAYGLDKVPHLGAASGYNDFNNIDKMVVLGKLTLPEVLIKLYRFALFGKYDAKTRKVKQTIKYNNKCKLNYFTYDNEEERLIDLWYTGSMLQQAIGRARGVTNPCEIHVYTDFPI